MNSSQMLVSILSREQPDLETDQLDQGNMQTILRPSMREAAGNHSSLEYSPQAGDRIDTAIEARVQRKLKRSAYRAVRRVRCRCRSRVLELQGRMPSYYTVQVAINIARRNVRRDVQIQNCLEVVADQAE